VRRAGVVCGAVDAILWTVEGDELVVRAHHGPIPATIGARQPMHGSVAGVAAREARVIHVEDLTKADDFPVGREIARRVGWRTTLGAPLLREGVAIGALLVRRNEVRPFTDKQIALLQTFADEAVIAIENVRLFTELQTSNRELRTALDTQTATSDILHVISRTQTDVQPAFDAILQSAARLLNAYSGVLTQLVGDHLRLAAFTTTDASGEATVKAYFPLPLASASSHAQTVRRRAPLNIVDTETDARIGEHVRLIARARGYRSQLVVPMLYHDTPVGTISLTRREAVGFRDEEVALLETFAAQAVIAIENVRLFTELQEKNLSITKAHAQVTETLERQTATSDILRVISSSPTDVQPVFETIAATALRLCNAKLCTVFRFDGALIHLAALHHVSTEGAVAYRDAYPAPPGRAGGTHRAILTRQIVHIPDIREDPEHELEALARANDFGSVLAVPMLRDGQPVGAITVGREAGRSFSDAEIELLKTFASQALIAIENVRLFNETKEALERQTATAEVLRVISSSPTDVQPVFEMVVRNAGTLCGAAFGGLHRLDGGRITLDAHYGIPEDELLILQRDVFPLAISRESATGRAILDREVVHIRDIREDPGFRTPRLKTMQNYRTILAVPMMREGVPLGALALWRREVQPFSETEIGLVRTFADQAVIAIENVRLFKALESRNRDLVAALDQQTATGEILRVISSSVTDVQPVFDAIVRSAVRLCGASHGGGYRFDGELVHSVAHDGFSPEQLEQWRKTWPRPASSNTSLTCIAIRTREVIRDGDVETTTSVRVTAEVRANLRARGTRSVLVVPMISHDVVVGAIGVAHPGVDAFSDAHVELLRTFADQAVIAIENARLFKELQTRTQELTRSVSQLTALGEVGRAVSSTLDLETVLSTIVSRAVGLSELDGGVVFEYDQGAKEFVQRVATQAGGALAEARRTTRIREGEGVVGQTALTREPAQVADITVPGAYESRLRDNLIASGIRAVLAVPMVREGELIGCLVVSRNRPGEFTAETIELLRTFATQSALAIQNARLFREIEMKGRELEAASRHKSEFLANMSHELRTPLNAILGFSEVLSERLFGELNEKQDEYLKDIHTSGRHLLSLINDILDLSKIEAGKMELELSEFDLPVTIDNALTLVRERAARRGIAVHREVDERLGQIQADERKIRQVLLNLLSNAIKFTPEGGRIEVGAQAVDGSIEVSVTDTGIGIAPEDQEAVFEEFRQVGAAEKKVEGTGLGLALSRKFIELHGGRITVKSEVGQGSTFGFTIPIRDE
jgi:GAF domain-containing protein/anti-sigma regulatory factor (Ser/Thr protein kinase)